MRDTLEYIAQMQVDIILAKPMRERILRTMEMMQMTFTMAENRLKRTYPFLTYPQLRAEMFREMYRNDFPPDKLAEIAAQIEAFGRKKWNNGYFFSKSTHSYISAIAISIFKRGK